MHINSISSNTIPYPNPLTTRNWIVASCTPIFLAVGTKTTFLVSYPSSIHIKFCNFVSNCVHPCPLLFPYRSLLPPSTILPSSMEQSSFPFLEEWHHAASILSLPSAPSTTSPNSSERKISKMDVSFFHLSFLLFYVLPNAYLLCSV